MDETSIDTTDHDCLLVAMRYIRFLKVPKLHEHSIKAVITVTSDLGETFLDEHLELVAAVWLIGPDPHICLKQNLKWKPGMRALPFTIDTTRHNLSWPIRFHVSPIGAPESDRLHQVKKQVRLPRIISIWSDQLNPNRDDESSGTVERRFLLPNLEALSIWEETGESIARHLWYF